MKAKRIALDFLLWIVGSALFSLSVNMFSAPNGILQGGLTGIATAINSLFPVIPIGTAILAMNLPLFALSRIYLKGGFLLRTVAATVIFTSVIDIGAAFIVPYEGDKLLGCLFCGVLSGTGLALVFITGASTGGTDIVAMLIRKKYPRLSMGTIMLWLDSAIVLLSLAVYRSLESAMYAILVIFISAKFIDLVLYGRGHGKLIFIVTEKARQVCGSIMSELGRGVTVIPVTGGYTGRNKNMILCAAKASELRSVLRIALRDDPGAFTMLCEAGEIIGEGFSQ
ncbi:MAG: YitT family protein [Oscillospiraceae bacterium]|nr:YitT family protein [Oscillospiraceae bacterium]MDD6146803.1 YitT family protein [Oscillospiraceae bacterium]